MNQDSREMTIIRFETTPLKIGDWIILRLPENASAQLPSRRMTLDEGTYSVSKRCRKQKTCRIGRRGIEIRKV